MAAADMSSLRIISSPTSLLRASVGAHFASLLTILMLAVGAAGARAQEEALPPPWELPETENIDPWEPFNRRIFTFNEGLDAWVLRPVARAYRAVTPDPVEKGVSNFIANIYELNTVFNSILQGRVDNTFHSLGRFILNSTVGLGGFIDVATMAGVEHRPADFGQTLWRWGVDSGPFLMVPVVGPRTVRSGAGLAVDSYSALPSLLSETSFNLGFIGIQAIDTRAQLLKADEIISGDKYIFFRGAYLQQREVFLHGGVINDSFSDFEEGADFEDF